MSGPTTAPRLRRNPLDVAGKFETPEDRRRYYSELGRASGAQRIVLTSDEAAALAEAYRLLASIGQRAAAKVAASPPNDQTDANRAADREAAA